MDYLLSQYVSLPPYSQSHQFLSKSVAASGFFHVAYQTNSPFNFRPYAYLRATNKIVAEGDRRLTLVIL
jgi:hypothetical protein